MSIIHLVIASTPYEGYEVLKAFTDKEAASKFKEACDIHFKKKPKFPSDNVFVDDEQTITTQAYNDYNALEDIWIKESPTDTLLLTDNISIKEIELD